MILSICYFTYMQPIPFNRRVKNIKLSRTFCEIFHGINFGTQYCVDFIVYKSEMLTKECQCGKPSVTVNHLSDRI